jgi:hypothetical protein
MNTSKRQVFLVGKNIYFNYREAQTKERESLPQEQIELKEKNTRELCLKNELTFPPIYDIDVYIELSEEYIEAFGLLSNTDTVTIINKLYQNIHNAIKTNFDFIREISLNKYLKQTTLFKFKCQTHKDNIDINEPITTTEKITLYHAQPIETTISRAILDTMEELREEIKKAQ